MIAKALDQLWQRCRSIVTRGLVTLIDDAKLAQALQLRLLGGDVASNVERFQNYGFSSVPKAAGADGRGAEAIVLALNGSRDHLVAIVVEDRRYRPVNLQPGESIQYDDIGQFIHLTRNGIVINGGGNPVSFTNTPQVVIDCDLEVHGGIHATGDVVADGDVSDASGTAQTLADMRTTFNSHFHTYAGLSGNTSTPVPPPM